MKMGGTPMPPLKGVAPPREIGVVVQMGDTPMPLVLKMGDTPMPLLKGVAALREAG